MESHNQALANGKSMKNQSDIRGLFKLGTQKLGFSCQRLWRSDESRKC